MQHNYMICIYDYAIKISIDYGHKYFQES